MQAGVGHHGLHSDVVGADVAGTRDADAGGLVVLEQDFRNIGLRIK